MAEKPILFSGEMVRAILDGRKTMTRRTRGLNRFNGQPDRWRIEGNMMAFDGGFDYVKTSPCPYGRPGDLLWVRETWRPFTANGSIDAAVQYRADSKIEQVSMTVDYINRFPESPDRWRPSIFMPRWASRITLEVTAVRVERLQDISEEDAMAEGISPITDSLSNCNGSVYYFRSLWDSINSKRGYGWDVNPFVWVVEFRMVSDATKQMV